MKFFGYVCGFFFVVFVAFVIIFSVTQIQASAHGQSYGDKASVNYVAESPSVSPVLAGYSQTYYDGTYEYPVYSSAAYEPRADYNNQYQDGYSYQYLETGVTI